MPRSTSLRVIWIFFLLGIPASASEFKVKQEFGRSSQALVLEEEEDDAKFSFSDTSVGFAHGRDASKLRLNASHRQKNYKTRLTDYTSTRFEVEGWSKKTWRGSPLKAGAFGAWRDRDFDKVSIQSFRELRGGLYAQDFRGWSARTFASYYDYRHASNRSKVGGRLSRELKWRGVEVNPFIASERHNASSRRKFNNEAGASAVADPQRAHWDRVSLRAEAGQRDTKSLEEREDDLDYSFWDINLKSRHPIENGHVLRWEAAARHKDDKGGIFSHRGQSLEAGWKLPLMDKKGKERIALEPFAGWKRMRFTEAHLLTYERVSLGGSAYWMAWNAWRVEAEGKMDFYHFTTAQDHRQRISTKLSFKRALTDSLDVNLGAALRHALFSFQASLILKV